MGHTLRQKIRELEAEWVDAGDDVPSHLQVIRELQDRLESTREAINCGRAARDLFGGNIGGGRDVYRAALDALDLTKPLASNG